jgi:hypothetical protein
LDGSEEIGLTGVLLLKHIAGGRGSQARVRKRWHVHAGLAKSAPRMGLYYEADGHAATRGQNGAKGKGIV